MLSLLFLLACGPVDTGPAAGGPDDTAALTDTADLSCVDQIVATGNAFGDVAEDWHLPDQHGNTTRLHAFCADVVLLVASAFW
jgi:hypothetical protein